MPMIIMILILVAVAFARKYSNGGAKLQKRDPGREGSDSECGTGYDFSHRGVWEQGDMGYPQELNTPADCAAACNHQEGCDAFIFDAEGGYCDLFDQPNGKHATPGHPNLACMKTAANEAVAQCVTGYYFSHNGEWEQGDMRMTHNLNTLYLNTPADCAAACDNQEGCDAFMINTDTESGGVCLLFSQPSGKHDYPGSPLLACKKADKKAGAQCGTGYDFSHHGYWEQGDMRTTNSNTPADCAAACNNEAGCDAFMLLTGEGVEECHLFKDPSGKRGTPGELLLACKKTAANEAVSEATPAANEAVSEANPTCSTGFTSSQCGQGKHLKEPSNDFKCATETCGITDCCEANPTCSTGFSSSQCGQGKHLKEPSNDFTCATKTCGITDCCETATTTTTTTTALPSSYTILGSTGSSTCVNGNWLRSASDYNGKPKYYKEEGGSIGWENGAGDERGNDWGYGGLEPANTPKWTIVCERKHRYYTTADTAMPPTTGWIVRTSFAAGTLTITTETATTTTTTTTATVTREVVLMGDYDTVVGNNKTLFLQECSAELQPVSCKDVRPGSIVVTLSASGSTEDVALDAVNASENSLATNGLVLSSFGNLTVQEMYTLKWVAYEDGAFNQSGEIHYNGASGIEFVVEDFRTVGCIDPSEAPVGPVKDVAAYCRSRHNLALLVVRNFHTHEIVGALTCCNTQARLIHVSGSGMIKNFTYN